MGFEARPSLISGSLAAYDIQRRWPRRPRRIHLQNSITLRTVWQCPVHSARIIDPDRSFVQVNQTPQRIRNKCPSLFSNSSSTSKRAGFSSEIRCGTSSRRRPPPKMPKNWPGNSSARPESAIGVHREHRPPVTEDSLAQPSPIFVILTGCPMLPPARCPPNLAASRWQCRDGSAAGIRVRHPKPHSSLAA